MSAAASLLVELHRIRRELEALGPAAGVQITVLVEPVKPVEPPSWRTDTTREASRNNVGLVVDAVRELGPSSPGSIAARLGVNASQVGKSLTRAVELGELEHNGKLRSAVRYSVPGQDPVPSSDPSAVASSPAPEPPEPPAETPAETPRPISRRVARELEREEAGRDVDVDDQVDGLDLQQRIVAVLHDAVTPNTARAIAQALFVNVREIGVELGQLVAAGRVRAVGDGEFELVDEAIAA